MRILIIEDEKRVAKQLEKLVRELVGSSLTRMKVCETYGKGKEYILNNSIWGHQLHSDFRALFRTVFNKWKEGTAQ